MHALTLIAIAKLEISANDQNVSFLESAKLSSALFLFSNFTDEGSKTTHNWGANDGSNPLSISSDNFLDMSAHKGLYDLSFFGEVYDGENIVIEGLSNVYQHLESIKGGVIRPLMLERRLPKLGFTEFCEGGLVFFRHPDYRVLIRLPKFNYKPSQDDVGHFDVIYKDENIVLDAGTFSYFTDDKTFSYFQGVQSHNTIYRFTEPYSMSKLSRFIFGDWTTGKWSICHENHLRLIFTNHFSDTFERNFRFGRNYIEVVDSLVESDTGNIHSSITVNSVDLVIDKKFDIHVNGNNLSSLTVEGTVAPMVSTVPVSFCYGYKEDKSRITFAIKDNESKFVVRF